MSKGTVVGKFRAEGLVEGCATAYVLAVQPESGQDTLMFVCPSAVFDVVWVGAEISWSTRRVVEFKCSSTGNAPADWNRAHPDVHFIPAGKQP